MNTLKTTIAQYIKEAKKKGTIKMSLENLFMCCPVAPVAYSEIAGTNGRYVYKQEFFKTAVKHFPSFII
jgi:hypothetical protein